MSESIDSIRIKDGPKEGLFVLEGNEEVIHIKTTPIQAILCFLFPKRYRKVTIKLNKWQTDPIPYNATSSQVAHELRKCLLNAATVNHPDVDVSLQVLIEDDEDDEDDVMTGFIWTVEEKR